LKREKSTLVLTQDNKPITFISKTLNKTKQLYDIKNLRNYFYGVIGIEIQTDHQSLSFTISDQNSNVEMIRWYSSLKVLPRKQYTSPEQQML